MQFEKGYFSGRGYNHKEKLVKRHVLEVIKWASKITNSNLFNGQGRKALDVGCAYGYSSQVLEMLGYETCGVDLSRWGVRQAKTSSKGNYLVCDSQTKLPFKAAAFDLITCFDVLEHLPFPEKTIQNMFEICDGVMVCTTPNRGVEKPVRKLMRDFDETHINAKSPFEWENSIREKLDYKLLKVETFYDLTLKIANRIVLFKSFKVPSFGLTVRILVRR